MPNGQTLWLDDGEAAIQTGLLKAISGIPKPPGGDAFLILPWVGSGLHFFDRLPYTTRYTLYVPGFLRDYDEPVLWASLDRTAALIVSFPGEMANGVTDDPKTWAAETWSPFDGPHTAVLLQRLGSPIRADGKWYVFPFKHASPMPGY